MTWRGTEWAEFVVFLECRMLHLTNGVLGRLNLKWCPGNYPHKSQLQTSVSVYLFTLSYCSNFEHPSFFIKLFLDTQNFLINRRISKQNLLILCIF
jgi:hypothetical protein